MEGIGWRGWGREIEEREWEAGGSWAAGSRGGAIGAASMWSSRSGFLRDDGILGVGALIFLLAVSVKNI